MILHADALRRLFEKLGARSPPEQSSADGGRENRRGEHGDLGGREVVALGNACPAMKSDIVKPMPASVPAPASCRHEYPAGLTAMPARTAAGRREEDPSGLPRTRPADDRGDERLMPGEARPSRSRRPHCEREERQDTTKLDRAPACRSSAVWRATRVGRGSRRARAAPARRAVPQHFAARARPRR